MSETRRRPGASDRRAFLRDTARLGMLGTAVLCGLPRALRAGQALWRPPLDATAAGRSFNMLVLGDSIMWGQGLDDESKLTRKVQRFLELRLGRAVRRDVFAHSGARLARDSSGDARAPLPGEIPDWYPSIPHQIELANNWLAAHPLTDAEHAAPLVPANIHLVLIDGGINDVHVDNILTTDPTITDPVSWVRKLAHERCAPQMRRLLAQVLATYPNAKVVVTGYYPIVSELTDIAELGQLLGMFGQLGGMLDQLVDSGLRRRLGAQSVAFHEAYVSEVRAVVEDATEGATASATAASLINRGGIPVPHSLPHVSRCAFADVAFQPEHSFGAPHTMLYGVNAHDPAAALRATQCQQSGQGANPKCYWASAGHPNPAGAARYADAIERALEPWLAGWGGVSTTTVRQIPAPRF